MSKDWTGNSKTTFATLGASSHAEGDRAEHDYYATDPIAIDVLLSVEKFNEKIWEPSCGGGHLSRGLKEAGYRVTSTDLVERGYGEGGIDFLAQTINWQGDIITNPPYKYAVEFIEKALKLVPTGHKVAMFLKLQFLEGKARKAFFAKHPPKVIYVSSSRIKCAKNGDFDSVGSSAVAYAWYVWEKGFSGDPIIKWVN